MFDHCRCCFQYSKACLSNVLGLGNLDSLDLRYGPVSVSGYADARSFAIFTSWMSERTAVLASLRRFNLPCFS